MTPISSCAASFHSSTAPTASISASVGSDLHRCCRHHRASSSPLPKLYAPTFHIYGGIRGDSWRSRPRRCDTVGVSTALCRTSDPDSRPIWRTPTCGHSHGARCGGVSGAICSDRTFLAGELWRRSIGTHVWQLVPRYAIDIALEPNNSIEIVLQAMRLFL